MKRRTANALAIVLFGTSALALAGGCAPKKDARFATVLVAGKPVRAEVADTPALRSKGLMFRESLAPDEGMLFVYDAPQIMAFYMKNTSIPLSIAFIDSDLKIVRIAHMKPFDEAPHSSVMPVQYALEVNQNWFARNGVKTGARVEIPAEIRR